MEKMDYHNRQFEIQFLEMARNVSFVIFSFFLFLSFDCARTIIEHIQYPSFATFWKQMEGKLALGSCISGNFHLDIFIRPADSVESPCTSSIGGRTKRFHGRSW